MNEVGGVQVENVIVKGALESCYITKSGERLSVGIIVI